MHCRLPPSLSYMAHQTHSDCAGCCLYTVVAGYLPFDEPTLPALFRKISTADYPEPPWFSSGLCEVLKRMLSPKITNRCGVAAWHPALKSVI